MAILVGDIHGNVEKVRAFLGYKHEDLHIALGDYTDSFNEPPERQLEALQLLLDSSAILLWGNHDLAYLQNPPFGCSGYQGRNSIFNSIIESNKKRFLAAYAVDGWLLTHAGVQEGLVRTTNIDELAAMLNERMADFINNPRKMNDSIFNIGIGRGGLNRCGGIFWFDFKREYCLASNIKQIFGHTEVKEPVVTETFINLDTTNCQDTCYLFDTSTNKLVKLPLKPKKKAVYRPPELVDKYKIDIFIEDHNKTSYVYLNYGSERHREIIKLVQQIMNIADKEPRKAPIDEHKTGGPEINNMRIRDLPQEEQVPFFNWLLGKTRPMVNGIPDEDQDYFYPLDYETWKSETGE